MNEMIEDIFSDKNVVFITGAGISTLSGIPDFRGKNGLYTKGDNVEYMLSRKCFINEPINFYEFYKNNMMLGDYAPNIVHEVLVDLEKEGYISGIITQNIDNLHQRAGSINVIDIHGNGDKFYCTDCNKNYSSEEYVKDMKCTCSGCRGLIRPDIVLYGEGYDSEKYSKSLELIRNADVIVTAGSSLTVSTVSRFIELFHFNNKSGNLYIINNQKTPYDYLGTRIDSDLKDVFEEIKLEFKNRKKSKKKCIKKTEN